MNSDDNEILADMTDKDEHLAQVLFAIERKGDFKMAGDRRFHAPPLHRIMAANLKNPDNRKALIALLTEGED